MFIWTINFALPRRFHGTISKIPCNLGLCRVTPKINIHPIYILMAVSDPVMAISDPVMAISDPIMAVSDQVMAISDRGQKNSNRLLAITFSSKVASKDRKIATKEQKYF